MPDADQRFSFWQRAVAPEAIADVIVGLATDSMAPVSGAILPAYGS
jgi:hypothetical protein